jgi:hypothetical protein
MQQQPIVYTVVFDDLVNNQSARFSPPLDTYFLYKPSCCC